MIRMVIGRIGCHGRNALHPGERERNSDKETALVSLEKVVHVMAQIMNAIPVHSRSVQQVIASATNVDSLLFIIRGRGTTKECFKEERGTDAY